MVVPFATIKACFYPIGLGLWIERQAAVTLVCILQITVREQLCERAAFVVSLGWLAPGEPDCPYYAAHLSDDDLATMVHGGLTRFG